MPYPPITALPPTPSRNAPSTFSALMDAFLAAFPQFRAELIALAAYLDTLALATGPGLFQSGSAAAPGISWAGDTNTGLYRPGADQLAAATGGVMRWLLSNSGLRLDVPLTGTAVAQDPLDSTAGRLTRTGDGGMLGAAPTWTGSADDIPLGTVVTSGEITEQQAIDNKWPTISGALTTTPRWFVVECFGISTRTRQVAVEIFGNGGGPKGRQYTRVRHNAAWTPWRLVYTQATVLGVVSQAGGIPTDALIERGSNANGEYVRFTDGTQICTTVALSLAKKMAVGDGYLCENAWTFPAVFSGTPSTSMSFRSNSTSFSGFTGWSAQMVRQRMASSYANTTISGTAATVGVAFNQDIPDGASLTNVSAFAIGRWL